MHGKFQNLVHVRWILAFLPLDLIHMNSFNFPCVLHLISILETLSVKITQNGKPAVAD